MKDSTKPFCVEFSAESPPDLKVLLIWERESGSQTFLDHRHPFLSQMNLLLCGSSFGVDKAHGYRGSHDPQPSQEGPHVEC